MIRGSPETLAMERKAAKDQIEEILKSIKTAQAENKTRLQIHKVIAPGP